MDWKRSARALAVGLIIIPGMAGAGQAAPFTFDLDPDRSNITVDAEVVQGFVTSQFSPQMDQGNAGNLTRYTGTIDADIENPMNPSGIEILSAAADAGISGTWNPAEDGSAGSAEGDYGLFTTVATQTINIAFRDILADMMSPRVNVGPAGAFDASQITFTVDQGDIDYNGGSSNMGEKDLSGKSDVNRNSAGLLEVAGQQATLTVPVDAQFMTDDPDATVTLEGQLVGTATVPEPASAALFGGGLVGLLGLTRRRRSRAS